MTLHSGRSGGGSIRKNRNKRRVAFNLAALFVITLTVILPLETAFAQTADTSSSNGSAALATGTNTADTGTASSAPSTTINSSAASPSESSDAGTSAVMPSAPSNDTTPSSPTTPPHLTPATSPSSGLGSPNPQPVINGSFDQDRLTIDKNTGALDTTYPITIPPGRNNLQPDVSLTYNSQNSQLGGIFGEGWSINIPYIERLNITGVDNLYATNTPSYFMSSLDGQLATTTASSSYIARTENCTFNKYTFSNNEWIVIDKNGTQYTYGSTADSQQSDPNNASDTFKWMLKSVVDTNNNSITYSYFKDSGQIYPSSTMYTGNGSSTGIFEVDFLRTASTDNATSSLTGFGVSSNYRVSEIDAKANGSLVNKYILAYEGGDNGSTTLLSSITQTGHNSSGTAVSLPAATFSYQTQTAGWNSSSTWIPSVLLSSGGEDSGVRIVDVNGDGLPDIIYNDNHYGTPFAYINTGDGWAASSTWIPPFSISAAGNGTEWKIVDVNGDGLPDIIWNDSVYGSGAYLNDGHGWFNASSTWTPPVNLSCNGGDCGEKIVDVNGDGLPDIIYSDNEYGSPYAYINNGHGWTLSSTWTPPANKVQ
jgi:hypothetical protein